MYKRQRLDIARAELLDSRRLVAMRLMRAFPHMRSTRYAEGFEPVSYTHLLTHPRQLEQYRDFLVDGGEVWFKCDDEDLFEDSVGY